MTDLQIALNLLNETLATAIVIISASMLLYNLTRNLKNRVARTSGVVLASVTMAYMTDVLVSLGPDLSTVEAILRIQWVGLAFIPAATFHLSDALLATTGLPSRGRRRRFVRLLYGIATMFLLLAAFTDLLIRPIVYNNQISLNSGRLLVLYVIYYLIVNGVAIFNVQRAKQRCLTIRTRRRMAYLQFAMLTPIVGIFPYSVLLEPGGEFSTRALIVVNLANLIVVLMLLFLSYPLSFFGSRIPDRVVKADLMHFMLRGPATATLALVIMVYTIPATRFLGIRGEDFMPFAVVAIILLWQWVVSLSLPFLERYLIYRDEDDEQFSKVQTLSERLLTRSDMLQLIEAILAAICDYLQITKAFIARANGEAELIQSVGRNKLNIEDLQDALLSLDMQQSTSLTVWNSYWILPLYSRRNSDDSGSPLLIGLIGIESRSQTDELTEDEMETLMTFVKRAARTVDDMLLQDEIYSALEGLLPQITVARSQVSEIEFRPALAFKHGSGITLDRNEIIEQVRVALRHYWGGPGISSSRLLELKLVQNILEENENNPVRSLRAVLNEAINNQSPEGERDMKSPEWIIFNILTLRFIESRKVRETARRLYMSEANLYRKQNVAIEAVADTIIKMERELQSSKI